jgi:hypothetical protein
MKMKLFHILIGVTAAALMLGCGGKQRESNTEKLLEGEPDVDLYSHLTGIDDSTPVKVEKEPEPERPQKVEPEKSAETETSDNIGGSQGAFLPRLVLNGQETPGTYTVKRATMSGEIVKDKVPMGQEVRVDPGVYDIEISTDAVVGAAKLTLRDVEIEAGRRIKRDVKFPVGKITLVTGGHCVKKPIKIKEKGATDWYPGKFYTCQEITLMAGEYEAEMGGGKRGTPISGIKVYDGGIRDILIRPK